MGFVAEMQQVSCEVGTKSCIYLAVFHDKPRLNNKSSRIHREPVRTPGRPSEIPIVEYNVQGSRAEGEVE
jgi:hypothetical protein